MTVKKLIDKLSLIDERSWNMQIYVRKESDWEDIQPIIDLGIYDNDDDEPEDFVTFLIEQ